MINSCLFTLCCHIIPWYLSGGNLVCDKVPKVWLVFFLVATRISSLGVDVAWWHERSSILKNSGGKTDFSFESWSFISFRLSPIVCENNKYISNENVINSMSACFCMCYKSNCLVIISALYQLWTLKVVINFTTL